MAKGQSITYSEPELAFLRERKEWPRELLWAGFCANFDRWDVTKDNIKSLCTRKGWKTGRSGCFAPGHVPANKGKKMPFNENTAKTQFKAGGLPHNTKHLGHERLTKDGYIMVSIAETNPHTGYERRYMLKHIHEWSKANGDLPKDHCLKCMDGNKQNTDPSNWECIPRALLPRLNGRFGRDFDAAPLELKRTLLAIAKLEHAARQAKKGVTDADQR